MDKNASMMSEVRGQWVGLVGDDRKATATQITTRYKQNTISKSTTRQTNTTPGQATPVSEEQGTEVTISTGSPKLDNLRLEKHCLV